MGRVLVSRTDNAGSTVSYLIPRGAQIETHPELKGVALYRQQLDRPGSRHSLRSV